VVNKTDNTFQLSDGLGGSAVNLTSAGTGTNKFYTAVQNEIKKLFTSPIDITDYLNGVVLIPAYIEDASDISRIEFVLEEDNENYYTMNSVVDSVGDNLIDGLNVVRLSLGSKVQTGSPDPTNINAWRLRIITSTGSQTIIIDKITLQQTTFHYLEYYSNKMFIDGTTGAWKDTPIKGDGINLNRDAADILHYETTLLIAQSSSFVKVGSQEFKNFADQLKRKYDQYYLRHPSSEMPLSYNHLEEAEGFPELIGEQLHAESEIDWENVNLDSGVQFVDNETPAGDFDDVNKVFTLSHIPNPVNSLLLWLNGAYLTAGVDYTLSGNTITFTNAPSSAYAGLPFVAFYRYTL
jgi:hypothetical protein